MKTTYQNRYGDNIVFEKEANTVKMSSILDDVSDEVKFNQSTIGISTKKALETASSRIVTRMITKGIFTH